MAADARWEGSWQRTLAGRVHGSGRLLGGCMAAVACWEVAQQLTSLLRPMSLVPQHCYALDHRHAHSEASTEWETNEYYQHRNFKSEVKRLEQKVIGEEALHA